MPRKIRPIRVEGNIAYVPLTKGYEAIIDTADVHLVAGFNWCAAETPHTVYAARSGIRHDGKRGLVYLHYAITGHMPTDHRDCNGLNNRRCNLRIATASANQHNQRLARHNTTGVKGVSWDTRRQRFRVSICSQGVRMHVGYFRDKEAAATAYANASAKFHGEFGRTE